MIETFLQLFRSLRLLLGLVVLCSAAPLVRGQDGFGPVEEGWRKPLLSPEHLQFYGNSESCGDTASSRSSRFRLFGMPPGFLKDPVDLNSDDDSAATDPRTGPDPTGDGSIQVALGAYNPYFDIRSPIDPRSAGYYKLHAQYQVYNSQCTGICLGLQALTPAGLECDGVDEGPTFFSPALSWFHELGDGTAVQGFVGKSMRANLRWADNPERGLQYGMAWLSPFPGVTCCPGQSLHWFIEALGRNHPDPQLNTPTWPTWQMLPGVHWQVREDWWLSSGLVVPVGPHREQSNLLQITGSWRF